MSKLGIYLSTETSSGRNVILSFICVSISSLLFFPLDVTTKIYIPNFDNLSWIVLTKSVKLMYYNEWNWKYYEIKQSFYTIFFNFNSHYIYWAIAAKYYNTYNLDDL